MGSFRKVDEWTKQNCPVLQKSKQNGFKKKKASRLGTAVASVYKQKWIFFNI